jgi:hypothetical protein
MLAFHLNGDVEGSHRAPIEVDFHSDLTKKVATEYDVVVARAIKDKSMLIRNKTGAAELW